MEKTNNLINISLLQFDLNIYDIIIKNILFLIHNKIKINLDFLIKNDHNWN